MKIYFLLLTILSIVEVTLTMNVKYQTYDCSDKWYNCLDESNNLLGQICESTCPNQLIKGQCETCDNDAVAFQKCHTFIDRYLVDEMSGMKSFVKHTVRIEQTNMDCNQNSWITQFANK